MPSWAKPVEGGGWILRLQEVAGQRGQVRIRFAPGSTVTLTNLGETEPLPLDASGAIRFSPYQVISVLVSD